MINKNKICLLRKECQFLKTQLTKTYLRGISDAMELLGDPTENKLARFAGGVVGNAIPYASLRNQGIQVYFRTR